MAIKFAIGQDSHAYEKDESKKFQKPLILGGVVFEGEPCLSANSDGDVILHAITNAISGLTCKNILGKVADDMCKSGVTDSKEYLKVALSDLSNERMKITHISISIEALKPKFAPKNDEMRESISKLLGLPINECAITATTGEQLTAFGRGEGIMVFCAVTAETTFLKGPNKTYED